MAAGDWGRELLLDRREVSVMQDEKVPGICCRTCVCGTLSSVLRGRLPGCLNHEKHKNKGQSQRCRSALSGHGRRFGGQAAVEKVRAEPGAA